MQKINPILTVDKLGRRLNQKWLWRGVSFDLMPGETLGIVGPSGIGKSLLMRSLVFLDSFEEGRITFRDQNLKQWEKTALRRQMLYLSQTPGIIEGTVEGNLQAVWSLKGRCDGQNAIAHHSYSQKDALRLFKTVGRGVPFLQLSADRLSGGERQILGLVRGLQLNPQVLLLDEPTAALDPATTTQVETLLRTWVKASKNENRAYLWISHDPDQISRMTQRQLDLSGFAL